MQPYFNPTSGNMLKKSSTNILSKNTFFQDLARSWQADHEHGQNNICPLGKETSSPALSLVLAGG